MGDPPMILFFKGKDTGKLPVPRVGSGTPLCLCGSTLPYNPHNDRGSPRTHSR